MKILTKALLAVAVTTVLSISCLGQAVPGRAARPSKPSQVEQATKPCTLSQATLPKIGGIQIGAKYDDVLSLHAEIADDKFFQKKLEEENSGLVMINVSNVFDEPEHERPVEMSLFFVDRIVSVIGVAGRSRGDLEDFKSIYEAIASYSKFLGVTKDQWTIYYYGYAGILQCADFKFSANSNSEDYGMIGNSIYVHAGVKEQKVTRP